MSNIVVSGRSYGNVIITPKARSGTVVISGSGSDRYPPYEGEYTIVPILNDDRVLETKSKVMTDDLTVKAIPVVQTTNPFGGQTVVIG